MQLLGAAIWEYLYIYIYIYVCVCVRVFDFESIKMCCKKHRLPALGTMPIAPTLEYAARRGAQHDKAAPNGSRSLLTDHEVLEWL